MLGGISINCHSSVRIEKQIIIYIDPFMIEESKKDADVILITHGHYDHFSDEDINKVKNEKTIILVTEDKIQDSLNLGLKEENVIKVIPNEVYKVKDISIETIPSYNINKAFHPKENNWVGYILDINGVKYYIPGDTDITEENIMVNCDVAFIPIGGTYTMDYKEGAEFTNKINPKIVLPFHYGQIVGEKEDAIKFKELINKEIQCEILIK